MPKNVKPLWIICIEYADQKPEKLGRININAPVHYEKIGGGSSKQYLEWWCLRMEKDNDLSTIITADYPSSGSKTIFCFFDVRYYDEIITRLRLNLLFLLLVARVLHYNLS